MTDKDLFILQTDRVPDPGLRSRARCRPLPGHDRSDQARLRDSRASGYAAGIPYYAAQRRLQKLKGGVVFVPSEIADDIRLILTTNARLAGTLTHFSKRYSREEIRDTVRRRLPYAIHDRIRLALPHPFQRL